MLRELLELHAVARPRILDCTYGRGRIWGGLRVRGELIKTDVNQDLAGLDVACDWLDLPRYFARGSIDVLVWDPIHVSDAGRSSKLYARYVSSANPIRGSTAVTDLFAPFLEMAARLVRAGTGIVLTKMCDQVHSARYRWQVFALVAEAQARGWTACQSRVIVNPAPTPIPHVRHQLHTRNNVAYWIVLRNGPACHGPGRKLLRELVCQWCGETFWARRKDAETCSPLCRQHRQRGFV